jgi:hypothetical protein
MCAFGKVRADHGPAVRMRHTREVDEGEARALAKRISHDTGLPAKVGDDGDGSFWVDVDLPTVAGEVRAVVTAHDPHDWPWLSEKYVRTRLDPPR